MTTETVLPSTRSTLGALTSAVLLSIVTIVLLGFVYPAVVTAIAAVVDRTHADGSLVYDTRGGMVGTALSGQSFRAAKYFHMRPSAAGNGYDPLASSGTNLGPTSKKLIDATRSAVQSVRAENPSEPVPPADLVSSSGSGLDPDISPEAARYQIARVAKARGIAPERVADLVQRYTQGRDLGLFGEARVHVLPINMALDAQGK